MSDQTKVPILVSAWLILIQSDHTDIPTPGYEKEGEEDEEEEEEEEEEESIFLLILFLCVLYDHKMWFRRRNLEKSYEFPS